jgi:hypothetical protein
VIKYCTEISAKYAENTGCNYDAKVIVYSLRVKSAQSIKALMKKFEINKKVVDKGFGV